MKKFAIGCGALIGLLLIISIISSIVSKPAPSPTPTPTPVPTPSPAPTPTPPTPTPVLTPMEVELVEAVSRDLVEASASGKDTLTSIQVNIASKSDDPLEVTILPGTVFQAQSASVQSMMVIKRKLLLLDPRGSKQVNVSTACANMQLDVPSESDSLTIKTVAPPEDLIRLLNLPDFHQETFRVRQFAIWTITDNPRRDEYVGIGQFGVGTGPNDDEMQRIRTLFEKAGISTEKYQALQ